jgi:5-formyltetrahydrofolate cyclo-ligase
VIEPYEAPLPDVLLRREALRASMRARCDALDPARIADWGGAIQQHAEEFLERERFGAVFSYLSLPTEAPTRSITSWALASGATLAAMRLDRGSFDMRLHALRNLDDDLDRGMWGIPVPKRDCPEVDPSEIDVAIVPLTAVDEAGYRIGRGGGCYDRFLAKYRHVYALGLGFELQRVESCRPQPWDVPVDALVTERGIFVYDRPERPRR